MNILLAPTLELAKQLEHTVEATVEAEYGDTCIEGTKVTLAHHGSRASNPAPCNDSRADNVQLSKDTTILVSHLDLDTIGGILKLQGKWNEKDAEFWKAAEFIDVAGPHHIHELPESIQDKLNAVYAWNKENQDQIDRNVVTDVTNRVDAYTEALQSVLNVEDPNHETMIQNGRDWKEQITQTIESKLVYEDPFVRVFESDGPFCNSSYYSPGMDMIVPAIITHNSKMGSITLSFEDGGAKSSACEIMKELFGPEAGGRDGIAGSPRGMEYSLSDALTLKSHIERDKDINFHLVDHIVQGKYGCNYDTFISFAMDGMKHQYEEKDLKSDLTEEAMNSIPGIENCYKEDLKCSAMMNGHEIVCDMSGFQDGTETVVIMIDGNEFLYSDIYDSIPRFFGNYDTRVELSSSTLFDYIISQPAAYDQEKYNTMLENGTLEVVADYIESENTKDVGDGLDDIEPEFEDFGFDPADE